MTGLLRDFQRVSRRNSCPICGRPDWCLASREDPDDPPLVLCKRVESAHRWGDAGWLHRRHDRSGRPRALDEVQPLSWTEGSEKHEILLRVKRWTKHGRDRLYLAEVLPAGASRELGNYDLVQGRWYTKGTLSDLSRARQDATKALVLRVVESLGGEAS